MKLKYFLALSIVLISSKALFAQNGISVTGEPNGPNVISTAVPFLNIDPESRGGGMGSVGAATSSDNNSMYFNPAKYSFDKQSFGVSVSYTPWLRALVNDISLSCISGFYKIDKMATVSTSLRYFSMGTINFTNEDGSASNSASPNEFAFDVAYSRLLGKKFSGAVAMRLIYSDLYDGVTTAGTTAKAGTAYAVDVAFAYVNKTTIGGLKTVVSSGINFSNIGSKISYDALTKEFIPANLRLGGGYKVEIDQYNSISLNIDLNKLMVPTPDTTQSYTKNNEDNQNLSGIQGVFKSFNDAPGGMKEELQEITIGAGAEYWYNNVFAGRVGYFHENAMKGNRKYYTAGVGVKFNVFQIDCSYVIPVQQNNPLANTIRFTLAFDLSEYGKKGMK